MRAQPDNEPQAVRAPGDRIAVRFADAGSLAWQRVVHTQRLSHPDHADFYALAGELVDTLRALDALAGLLAGQTADYPGTVTAAGGHVDDDEWAPAGHRIRSAVLALAETRQALSAAERAAGTYWSAISHVRIAAGSGAGPSGAEVAR